MDLTLSDFFLFGHIKQRTVGQEFASPDKLIDLIRGEFDFIPRSVFENVFDDWPDSAPDLHRSPKFLFSQHLPIVNLIL
jgi:hypothetical protein